MTHHTLSPGQDPIVELIGIYNAEGTLGGELRYLLGKLSGRAHCGLCDITHGRLRRRSGLDASIARLEVPTRFIHADEATPHEADASGGALPCVLARLRSGHHDVLMGPGDLDACQGDVDALVTSLERRLRR